MATLSTKLLIADALVELCETDKLNKISVSDIIEMTGKNRKTFYYHFEDKESLIIWKFRYDLGQELLALFPADVLIYEDPIDKNNEDYKDFPYYITQKSGVRSLDHSAFLMHMHEFCIVIARFIRKHFWKPGHILYATISTISIFPHLKRTSISCSQIVICLKKISIFWRNFTHVPLFITLLGATTNPTAIRFVQMQGRLPILSIHQWSQK